MNRKGFTLIEVMVIIAIIAILLLLLVPNVFVMLNKNNEKICTNLKDNIESAVKMYVTNNKYELGFSCDDTKDITLQTLVDSGDLKLDSTNKIINPINDIEVPLNSIISVTYNCNSETFNYVINGINCNYSDSVNNEYTITLDNMNATSAGTNVLYGKYTNGIFLDNEYTNGLTTSDNAIVVPIKEGYTFGGYYTGINGSGTQMISSDGYITSSFTNTLYIVDTTLYAKWVDTSIPTCVISGNPTEWTTNDITLMVIGSDDGALATSPYSWISSGYGFSTTTEKTVTRNGKYTAYVKDASGNVGSCSIDVTKIDKSGPTAPVYSAFYADGSGNYNSGSFAYKQVYTTVTSSDIGSGIDYMEYSKDGINWIKLNFDISSLTQNGISWNGTESWSFYVRDDKYYFRAVDNLGNKSDSSLEFNIVYGYNTISYDANGGTGIPDSQSKTYGENLILSTIKPTRTGYTFTGWNTKSDGSGTNYSAGGIYSEEVSSTLYAQWRINKVYIKFHVNGGTITSSTTSSGTTYNWTITDSIVYRNSSSTFFSISYGSSNNLPNYNNSSYINISRTGYSTTDGAEWICSSGCSTANREYDHDVNYMSSDFCDASNGDCLVTVKVNWKINTYTISYNANGGSGAPGSQTKTYGKTLTLSSTTPTRSGYTFLGWSTSSTATSETYKSGGEFNTNANTILYAVWKASSIGNYLVSKRADIATLSDDLIAGMYRYQGTAKAVDNNYICFGTSDKSTCTSNPGTYMYRIVGITSSGQIRVIKKTSIGNYVWHSNYAGVYYGNSTLKSNLNGSTFLSNTTYLPGSWSDKIVASNWRWWQYGIAYDPTQLAYNGVTLYNSYETTSVSAKIGIIAIYEYYLAYGSTATCNSSGKCLSNWIDINNNGGGNVYEWTTGRRGNVNGDGVYYIMQIYNGYITDNYGSCTNKRAVRPMFNISSSVNLIGGAGTESDPYIVS